MNKKGYKEYTGICVVTGQNGSGKTKALFELLEKYPKAKIFDEPEQALDPNNAIALAEKLLKGYKENKQHLIISTKSMLFLRAIECYSDYFGVMRDLNVYDMDSAAEKGNIDTAPNVMYSEYGISEIYDKYNKAFKFLDNLIDRDECDTE